MNYYCPGKSLPDLKRAMIMNRNACGYFQIMITLLLILLIIRCSFFVDAFEIITYPSIVNGPNSWINTPSSDFGFLVKPILVNGMFVCGFHCSFYGYNCLFSVSIFKTTSDGDSGISPQVVWSANRNNPIKVQAVLELTSDGQLLLKDANNDLVWSTGTVIGKSGSRLNLSPEGNLMLLDKNNRMVWQSFDHPTDSVVLAQRLFPGQHLRGQHLRASVSPLDSSEGLYVFAIYNGQVNAYTYPDFFNTYYTSAYSNESYVVFQRGSFGSLLVPESASFIKFESDGHLKAYEWRESKWEGTDLLDIPRCLYPSACGTYGVCLETGCSCPDDVSGNKTVYFRPINVTNPNLGCSAVTPLSCQLSLHHSFIELQETYAPFYDFFLPNTTKVDDCKEACLKNCSCKAAITRHDFSNSSKCFLLSHEFYLSKTQYRNYLGYTKDESSVFIKVQNSPISETPNRNPSWPSFPERKKHNTAVIVGSTLGAIFGVLLICTSILLRYRKGFQEVEEDYLDMLGMPTRFCYEELKNITKNFNKKLGQGGFGSVFQGTLPSGTEVAVKQLVGFGSVNKSFVAEVQTIGSIHHFNLVSLVGFCAEKSNRLLVYEYMANGSLDRWIFNANHDLALGWQIRKKIILDIAKGLAYLHEDCNQKIIHLDIKPQNILLDENFHAKVADFGLSKLIGKDQSRVITTMRGTPGYMAPEWLSSIITEKVDVYSFGIVVLEILCGRRNVDGSQHEEDRHLLGLFRRKQEQGQLMDLVDKCGNDMQSHATEVVEMMKVAAWCLQTEYAKRPSMSTVVKLLEGSVDAVINVNEDFLNGLTDEAMETLCSTVLPSMLSGPR